MLHSYLVNVPLNGNAWAMLGRTFYAAQNLSEMKGMLRKCYGNINHFSAEIFGDFLKNRVFWLFDMNRKHLFIVTNYALFFKIKV